MRKRLINRLWLALVLLSLIVLEAKAEEVWLENIPVEELQQLYQDIGYEGEKGYLMLPSYKYPAIFLKNFPEGYDKITDEKLRNALFIKILAPLTLKLNEELLNERSEVAKIEARFKEKGALSKQDVALLEEKAEKYDVFTRLKGQERYSYILSELLIRIDRVPPSIMITAAAIETNWGTSRVVREANSLYKTLVWHTKEGLKPIGENEDDSYRIKIYPNIYAAMQEFALKINSHPVFATMRNFRRERRERTNNISGMFLAPYTYGSSGLKNYAGIFDYTMAYYELTVIDKSSLDLNMILGNDLKRFEKYVTKM